MDGSEDATLAQVKIAEGNSPVVAGIQRIQTDWWTPWGHKGEVSIHVAQGTRRHVGSGNAQACRRLRERAGMSAQGARRLACWHMAQGTCRLACRHVPEDINVCCYPIVSLAKVMD